MTPNLLRVADFPNFNGISVTSREAFNEQATGIVPSPSPDRSNPCCLPPELLAAIFLEYMQRCEELSIYATSWVPPWVNVSYVCRYWRSVALNCANLWRHLFFVSSEWMDELLRRSKTAPLIIRIDFCCPESDPWPIRSLEKALDHMERIQDLWINCCRSKDVLNVIGARLTAAAPLLRSLHLSTYKDRENHFIIRKNTLPGAGLRRLHLELCHVDWSFPIFNGLRELTLSSVVNDGMECWDGLLLLLSQLPLLRRLCLNNILLLANIDFEDSFINAQNRTKVSLCQLEKLTLIDPIPWVTALLARLEFPSSTIVQVKSYCDNPEDISMFVPFMESRFSRRLPLPQSTPSPQSTLRSLSFLHSDLREGTWKFMYGTSNPANASGTNKISLEERDLNSQFPLQIILTRMARPVSFGVIIPLLRALPITHLNAITLYSSKIEGSSDDQNPWTEVFRDAPGLRIVKVGYGCANMFIHALRPRDGVIFASTLTVIRFKGIQFSQRKCSGEESHDYGTACFQCLYNALASRVEAGIVLQRLFLENCSGILESNVTELSRIVNRVEWDPAEG